MKFLEMVKDKKIKHKVSHPHSKVQEVVTSFYWGRLPLEALGKDFYLAIGGGLGWMK